MGKLRAALSFGGLSFAYGGRPVLERARAAAPEGRFTAVLGPNGSGKSTLLRLAAGLLEPSEGRVLAFGEDVGGLPLAERSRLIGFLGQKHRPAFPFRVEDVVLTGRAATAFSPGRADREAALGALERVGAARLRDRPYTELSGGEQQLVLVARVLSRNPRILLLDEPTTHLDLPNQARLLGLLRDWAEGGMTVVAVLHDPNFAFAYAHHFLFIRDRRIVRPAAGRDPRNARFLGSVYGVRVDTFRSGRRVFVMPSEAQRSTK